MVHNFFLCGGGWTNTIQMILLPEVPTYPNKYYKVKVKAQTFFTFNLTMLNQLLKLYTSLINTGILYKDIQGYEAKRNFCILFICNITWDTVTEIQSNPNDHKVQEFLVLDRYRLKLSQKVGIWDRRLVFLK
jgi:hypothetical protein